MFRLAELPIQNALHRSQGEPGGQDRQQAEQKHAGRGIEGLGASGAVFGGGKVIAAEVEVVVVDRVVDGDDALHLAFPSSGRSVGVLAAILFGARRQNPG